MIGIEVVGEGLVPQLVDADLEVEVKGTQSCTILERIGAGKKHFRNRDYKCI
jgi:hypothetical protein